MRPPSNVLLNQGFYTILFVCLNVIVVGGGSNLFPLAQLSTFTPKDIEERIKGSKIVIVSEQVRGIYGNSILPANSSRECSMSSTLSR
jgi:hypothetical protein